MSLGRRTFLKEIGAGIVGCAAIQRALEGSERPRIVFDPGSPEKFWRAVRSEYPILDGPAYLNTGGLGPAPGVVLDAVDETSRRLQLHSETGHAEFESAREVLAGFMGADPEEVCFTRNATEGNSIIAGGLSLKPGDEVIFETHAHPGGSFPWLNQARRRGVVVRLFEPDATSAGGNIARIEALLSPRTKVVQVSHVTCTTGLVFPVGGIASLAHAHGAWFHVDGAQAAGMLTFEMRRLGCDSYAFSGHKWLGGPHETGILFIRRDRLDDVACISAGAYTGDVDHLPGELIYAPAASRHEYGTRSAALIAGLAEAVRFQERVGRERIAHRGRQLADRLYEGLSAIEGIEVLTPHSPAMRASMVTFRHPRASSEKMFGYLMSRHGLRCRPVNEQGLEAIRVSTHIFNSPDDCDRVIAAARASANEF